MTQAHRKYKLFASFLLLLTSLTTAHAGDWPMYRHDLHRSGITDEKLTLPLALAWRYDAPQPPAPAWPEPVSILNRMDFDYAPHPVIAGGVVFLASSSDDTLRAFDAATGKEKWRFTAGGPIRFAPQVSAGRVYFAADDAVVYCLDAANGKTVWTFSAAPTDERMIGNNRMISRWPIRTGVAVVDASVYALAGVWPNEGLYAYSLDAATGKVKWCNDTCGGAQSRSVGGGKFRPDDPHSGEFGEAGLTPQGALLVDNHVLVVPLANNTPALFNRTTGALMYFFANSSGSANVIMDGDMYYRPIQGKGPVTIFGTRAPSRGGPNRAHTFPANEIPQLETVRRGSEEPIRARGKMSFLVKDEKLTAKVAYGLSLSDSTLLLGGDRFIAARDHATDKELWRADVDGEAREIAVSDGRVFVTTDRGTLYCFAPAPQAAPIKSAPPLTAANPPSSPAASAVLDQLKSSSISRGYALVIGDPDAQLALALAHRTQLQIVMPMTDPAAAQSLRDRLVTATALYGSRIHVHTVASLDRLPFAQYFANAVIIAGPAEKLSAKELYRVTQPCGGLVLAPGLSAEKADELLRGCNALKGELVTTDNGKAPAIRRVQLPGARDWNTGDEPDRHVKWPIRPLWFGGPTSALGMFSRIGQHPPIAAAGRYFIMGDATLSAVDAYNGVVLWTRPIPNLYQHLRKIDGVTYSVADSPKNEYPQITTVLRRQIGADDEFVYLSLGKSYFRGDGDACIKLDVRTGEQVAMYGPFKPGRSLTLDKPRNWPIEVDKLRDASVGMEANADCIKITLTTKTPDVTPLDSWDLFFDFRAPEARYGLYERGAFQITVTPTRDSKTPAAWTPGSGPAHPRIQLTDTRIATGSTTTVTIPWSEIDKLTGARPRNFGFGATLVMHDGEDASPLRQHHLFCDVAAPGVNNGWTTIVLGDESEIKPAVTPSLLLGAIAALPTEWTKRGAVNPEGIDEQIKSSPRVHPLTGELVPKVYRSGAAGCGRLTFSDSSTFGRAGKLSISMYDFDDDSGLRNFAGIASNCGPGIKAMSIHATMGLLIAAETRSHCDCMVPIRTTVAFGPAERRLNEDWATFFDRDVDTQVRSAAINFGAPGDRRDASGRLWLGFPRPGGAPAFPLEAASRHIIFTAPPISSCLQVPMTIERSRDGGVVAVNADRVAIEGTDNPWLYTTALRGIQKATLRVDLLGSIVSPLLEKPVDQAPLGEPQKVLPFTRTEIFLQHDADNLYITARRPAVTDRTGKIQPWTMATKGDDATVWDDDSFEFFVSDSTRARIVHLGVAASGAHFDAISIDAKTKEDRAWNGKWTSAALANEVTLKIDLTVPLKTLTDAGLDVKSLAVNFQMNQKNLTAFMTAYPGAESNENPTSEASSEPMATLGFEGRTRCANFAPLGLGAAPPAPQRSYTVRLHFAELQDIPVGARIFDVKIQGKTVLENFDIVKEAGGLNKALVKEFPHVQAGDSVVLEFVNKGKPSPAAKGVPPQPVPPPQLNAMEVIDENFRRVSAVPK